MKQYINVWVERHIPTLDALTYQCNFFVEKGMRVIVPLQSKPVVGLVSEVNVEILDSDKIKDVIEVIDKEPIFSKDQFELLEYLYDISVTNHISLLKAMLPNILKPASFREKISKDRFALVDDETQAKTVRQKEVIAYVKQHQPLLYKDYREYAKSLSIKLIEMGAIKTIEKDKDYQLLPNLKPEAFYDLTDKQVQIYNQIQLNQPATYLLFGVTGSGKTEIFMHLVRDTLAAGKNAMILVPEVALTPQMIERFSKRFDQNIVVYHSHLSNNERYHQYMQIKNGQASIIIGTRSSVFLPMDNIGIVIMDEEHDLSFKQDTPPYYHVKDVAQYLSRKYECPLVLASATPSLESYARALKGVYTLLSLDTRINESQLNLSIVNMKDAIKAGHPFISQPLYHKIKERLVAQEQIILLLNRRGYAPTVVCDACFEMATCNFCEHPLTYHHNDKKLHCHHCAYVYDNYTCKKCNHHRFIGSGIATQRLEKLITSMFKGARVGRLDYDATRIRDGHQKILDDFTNHKFDILIGTQMVAKGLDIPNVTLVGILQADAGLLRNDFHANESTYAMISQAAGRGGRHHKQGEVIIQVFNEDHYVIDAIKQQDYELFFKHEMNYRQLAQLPPYVYLIACMITTKDKNQAQSVALEFSGILKEHGIAHLGPSDLGPIRNAHRYRLVLKTKDLKETTFELKAILKDHQSIHRFMSVNVSPLHLE